MEKGERVEIEAVVTSAEPVDGAYRGGTRYLLSDAATRCYKWTYWGDYQMFYDTRYRIRATVRAIIDDVIVLHRGTFERIDDGDGASTDASYRAMEARDRAARPS